MCLFINVRIFDCCQAIVRAETNTVHQSHFYIDFGLALQLKIFLLPLQKTRTKTRDKKPGNNTDTKKPQKTTVVFYSYQRNEAEIGLLSPLSLILRLSMHEPYRLQITVCHQKCNKKLWLVVLKILEVMHNVSLSTSPPLHNSRAWHWKRKQ